MLKKKQNNTDSLRVFLRAKRHFADHRLTSVASACFYSPAWSTWGGVWQRLMRLCCLTVFTSSPLPLPPLPALGPGVIPVCLLPKSNELNGGPIPGFFFFIFSFFFCSVTILPLTPGPPRCLLWLWWYLRVCRRQRVGTSGIIPQHALAVWLIPTGMSHSPHHPSHQ